MIDCIVHQIWIYFTILFGTSKVLFFSPIVKVGLARTENDMELFGYTTEEWFLMAALLGVGSFWLTIGNEDDGE